MAAASLLLAGKADERPKSLRDVMRTCFEVRYSKRPKELDKIVDAVSVWLSTLSKTCHHHRILSSNAIHSVTLRA